MIDFLQKNKDLSFTYSFEKERIERDITLFGQYIYLFQINLSLAKIDEKDTTSPIFVLDSPNISSKKQELSFIRFNFYIYLCIYVIFLTKII